MEAVWGTDYDMFADNIYERPNCPECDAPIRWNDETGGYSCVCCGKAVEVSDPKMKKWLEERAETKTDVTDCFFCNARASMKNHYRRNPVTMEWEVICGRCEKCGARYMV